MKRRALLAALSLVSIVAAGCTGGPGGDKAGGSGPVVLKMANTGSDLPFTPALGYFVNRVNELSGGGLRIDVVYRWGNFAADAEQQAVRAVQSGKVDLTSVGTQVFDTLGVDSFQALDAPMLIDSYALQNAVVKSDIPSQMLTSLDPIGVRGLAVIAAGLPRLIAVHKPLLGPADWRGIRFQAYRSSAHTEAIRALGAQPTDTLGGLRAGLESGSIQGFTKSLTAYQINQTEDVAPYVTANVNLWPGMAVLLANPGRLSRLTDEQQGWLFQAAADARARSTGTIEDEDRIVANVCKVGARFADASAAQLAGLRRAFAPVYASLEQAPQTRAFIASIQALKASTPPGPPLAIPPGCTGPVQGRPTANDPIAGTWTTAELTETQIVRAFIAAGGSEQEGHALFAELGDGSKRFATITMKFQGGLFHSFQSGDGRPPVLADVRSYVVANDGTVTFTSTGASDCIGALTDRYDLKGDTLRLHVLKQCSGGDGPYNTTLYATFPFTRSS